MIHRMRMMSPIGPLMLHEESGAIVRLEFGGNGEEEHACGMLCEAVRQLNEYFAGKRKAFDLPVRPAGTPFQQAVWAALRDIPYGETRTYQDIARAVGRERAFRAVGMANHRNPVPIIIPCHRVIGADGSMTGYAGGIPVKRALLRTEEIEI